MVLSCHVSIENPTRSPGKAASAFNDRTTSLVPRVDIYDFFYSTKIKVRASCLLGKYSTIVPYP